MITITDRALTRLDTMASGNGLDGILLAIRWDRGDADNVRGPDGKTTWIRTPSRGWQVDVFGDSVAVLSKWPELQRFGSRVFAQPWLLPNPPFPGGLIDLEDDNIVFKANQPE
jgi:hypothetical protein